VGHSIHRRDKKYAGSVVFGGVEELEESEMGFT